MSADVAVQLIALGAAFVLGIWSGRAWALASQHVNGMLGTASRDADVNIAAAAAEDDELPYRPASDPYRFTYDQALRDIKPAADRPPAAPAGGVPPTPPAPNFLSDEIGRYPV